MRPLVKLYVVIIGAIAVLLLGHDLSVLASWPHTWAPWVTIAANRALTITTNILFGSSITDMETCYKIMRADVARSLKLDANRFDIEPQITARLLAGGHRIHELPVTFQPRSRAQGKKIGWRDGVRAIEVLVTERFRSANPKAQTPNPKSQ